MAEETVPVVDAEILTTEDPAPLVTDEDIIEAFRMVFDEIVLLKASLAEALRQLDELKAKSNG
jgi:hypothetical protein